MNKDKIKVIFSWLQAGKSVFKVGSFHAVIWSNGEFFGYNKYGTSAIKATEENLTWLLTEIFDYEDEFYIINSDGEIEYTNALIAESARKEYTFTFYSRNIWTYQEKPLFQVKKTFDEMITNYHDIAEKYSKQHLGENHVHFAVSCEFPFVRYWNFAI